MSVSIYILRLQNGKYYVGKTNNIERRKQDYLNGNCPRWCKTYKPIGIDKIVENASNFDEDKYVKEYMAKYGIDNVRGGSYVTERLDIFQKELLQQEIWGAMNNCTNCGRKGHFVETCYAKTDINGESLMMYCCEKCHKGFATFKEADIHEKQCFKPKNKITCFRCGRHGHYANQCYASTHV